MTRSRERVQKPESERFGREEAGGKISSAGAASSEGTPGAGDNDAALVKLALKGSEEAFEKLFERYRERVYRVAYGWCHEQQTALDLVQDVFVKAFRSLDRFRSEASFWTWLCRIAINRCLDHARKKGRSREIPVESPQDIAPAAPLSSGDPAEELQYRELKTALAEAIEELSPEAKTAFMLRFFDDMSYRDMAKTLDCSVGTVMSRLFYARQKLRALLQDYL